MKDVYINGGFLLFGVLVGWLLTFVTQLHFIKRENKKEQSHNAALLLYDLKSIESMLRNTSKIKIITTFQKQVSDIHAIGNRRLRSVHFSAQIKLNSFTLFMTVYMTVIKFKSGQKHNIVTVLYTKDCLHYRTALCQIK